MEPEEGLSEVVERSRGRRVRKILPGQEKGRWAQRGGRVTEKEGARELGTGEVKR